MRILISGIYGRRGGHELCGCISEESGISAYRAFEITWSMMR